MGDDELDLSLFERSVTEARQALSQNNPRKARELLAGALALSRGPALAEFAEPFGRHEAARLEELRLAAVELRIEAELALGHQRDVVGELETLIAQHPLRERLRSQHMLALYRSGRHAEALASYQTFRRTLAEARDRAARFATRAPAANAAAGPPPSSYRRARRRVAAPTPAAGIVSTAPVGEVSYARSGDIRIAYQVIGDGSVDLVLVHGWVCTFQPGWEYPKLAAFHRRLASMGRLILFDKRGTGLSDRVSPERLPDLETRMDDVRAVLDSVGSERAVLLGLSEGGAMSTLFAATHPARTAALVLMGTFPREMQAPDYPWGVSERSPPAPRPPRGGRLGGGGDERLARPRRPGHAERPGGAALVHVVRATRRQPRRDQGAPAHERRDRHPRPAADDQRPDPRAPSRTGKLARRVSPWASTSRARAWSSCRETTTSPGRAIRTRCSTRSDAS